MIADYLTPQIIIPTITSILSGAWIAKDFFLKRDLYPKIKIESSLRTLTAQDSMGNSTSLLTILIKNKGIKRLYFDRGEFSIRCLPNGENLSTINLDGIIAIDFKNEIVSKSPMFPSNWEYSWVDGEDYQEYYFPVLIPPVSGILLLKIRIKLRERRSDFIERSFFFTLSKDGRIEKIKSNP